MDTQRDKLSIVNATLVRGMIDPKAEHIKERIPTSVFFDFEELSDASNPVPLMLPSQDIFTFFMKSMDVRITDTIVCYDQLNMISAPRAHWMFKVFGAPNVYILNGAFHKWKAEGRPTETGDNRAAWHQQRKTPGKEEDYEYIKDESRVITYDSLHQLLDKNAEHDAQHQIPILDSRFDTIFNQGHIPTSKNLPFNMVLNENRTYKSPTELKDIFKQAGVRDPIKDEVALTCQRGITACILEAALRSIGNDRSSVYDGSYEEYAEKKKLK